MKSLLYFVLAGFGKKYGPHSFRILFIILVTVFHLMFLNIYVSTPTGKFIVFGFTVVFFLYLLGNGYEYIIK